MSTIPEPAYRRLPAGELHARADRLAARLSGCDLCPRECGVDRTAGETGCCGVGLEVRIASFGPHYGEERPLVGFNGSGTVFFAGCNLGCAFCQNHDISQTDRGRATTPETLAGIFLQLEELGLSNLNLATPTHVTPQVLRALAFAAREGLRLPLVWNCGGYERLDVLALLDGVVDIYMPDFKVWEPAAAERLLSAPDYPKVARLAITEMHRQVGSLECDADGIARRGLLLRHLVLPNGLAGTVEVARFVAALDPNTYFNLMDQYRPCHRADSTEGIGRIISQAEWQVAVEATRTAGLRRLDREIE